VVDQVVNMPMTKEDLETIKTLIAGTVQALLAAQQSPGGWRCNKKLTEFVDERYYRKIGAFSGEN